MGVKIGIDLETGKQILILDNGSGGSTTEVALLSVTTAPSGSFAVGSKYYDSSTKKILTAVTADTWTGATSADPVFNVIYTFNSLYYAWDGNSLEQTDLNLYATKVELSTGLAGKIDKYSTLPTPTIDFVGIIAQYVGTTGDGGTNGYFYKGTSTPIDSSITAGIGTSTGITEASVVKATFEGLITTTGTYDFIFSESTAGASTASSTGITNVSVNKAVFETLITVSGTYDFVFDGTNWKYNTEIVTLSDYGITVTGTPNEFDIARIQYFSRLWRLNGSIISLLDYGITVTGTPNQSDVVVIEYTASSFAYSWELINVQPATVVPDASNTVAGKIRIATDGEVATGTAENLAVNPKQLADGLDSIVVPSATTEIEGIVELATDSEVITGTSETKVINAKQLKDRGAEFQQLPFTLQSDVLSTSAKRVVKSGTFFVF